MTVVAFLENEDRSVLDVINYKIFHISMIVIIMSLLDIGHSFYFKILKLYKTFSVFCGRW